MFSRTNMLFQATCREHTDLNTQCCCRIVFSLFSHRNTDLWINSFHFLRRMEKLHWYVHCDRTTTFTVTYQSYRVPSSWIFYSLSVTLKAKTRHLGLRRFLITFQKMTEERFFILLIIASTVIN